MYFRFQWKYFFSILSLSLVAFSSANGSSITAYHSKNLSDPYLVSGSNTKLDTVPLKDRPGDFTNPNKRNPFDLKDPGAIDKSIEYDIKTGRYLINERIGNEYYRTPSYMSFDEYLKWRAKTQEREYFDRLSGVSNAKSNKKDPLSKLSSNDPLKKIDLKNQLLDRLFGGSTVDIRTQGNIDVTLGGFYQKNENPTFPVRAQTQSGFDFDMAIRMNVTGKIGEKLNLSTNYNTQATFDFENQMKLNYDTKNFSEDAIVQKIEAGNVSLPLKGNLIQGAQSLFGLKTELQFGYLRLTGIASQQKSQRQNIKLQGGSQVQQFRLTADQYDENRHFFLSHINRQLFEGAMKNLPQVNTQIKITRLEVWVTNDRNSTEEVRDIIALADLGEADPNKFTGTTFKPNKIPNYNLDICNKLGVPLSLPDNDANDIYKSLLASDSARQLQNVVNSLQRIPFLYEQSKDFEKIRARKLNLSEYSFNEDLGFISLNVNLRPNQVLGVAYEYTFNGVENHRVGEFSNDAPGNTDTLGVLFVKMLKSQITNVRLPVWDLMMKNVYSTGAYQANREDFRLDIVYQDPRQGNLEKRFLPERGFEKSPLLNVFGLDRLNIQGDPQPDGIFDYVPGITINSKTGRIMFPVLEPFGSFLDSTKINKDTLDRFYRYQELYDSTITFAREFTEKNRFVIKGQYKSSSSSEISLGGINVPRGSVRVSAGSTQLVEGRDYEVDYTIGKVRILNDAYISSSLPINVSYEDNTLFGFQTKTLLGARADYSLGKQLGIGDLNIGATYMHLFERPFTQKVNIGDDPINNRIYGMDLQYNAAAPWITRLVDKLPFYSTKQPSNISVTGEAALLQPGHASAINQSKDDSNGAIYIDDFEGSTSSIDLRQPVSWVLSSVPKNSVDTLGSIRFRESSLINDLRAGVNRASISWYRIDQGEGGADNANPYTANIDPSELFRNTFFQPGQNIFNPFDIHYNPLIRGPYNFEIPEGHRLDTSNIRISAGLEPNGQLKNPKSRWGGMMRAIQTTDFEQANVEFLEFWMLSPFIGAQNNNPGTLQIHLGNISEDVLQDSRTFYENALPTPLNSQLRTDTTRWGRIPRIPPVTIAFDNDPVAREMQDVGLDGFNNEGERKQYADYLAKVKTGVNAPVYDAIEKDPANDDFKFFRDESYRTTNADAITRYSRNNFPEGNSKSSTGADFVQAATNFPDIEDLNRDNSLNESENYYLYNIPLKPDTKEGIDTAGNSYITDTLNYVLNGQNITWYRFRIPIAGYKAQVGSIRDFRAIQFIRFVMTDFERPVTLRFARMELGRNQWRKYRRPFKEDKFVDGSCITSLFDLNKVNVEENAGRQPFNYVIPTGIVRENNIGGFFQNALQNEQSLALRMEGLCPGRTQGIYKLLGIDLRLYDRMKMFVHAEGTKENDFRYKPGQLSTFIRIGSDLENNYYEYELPMVASNPLETAKYSSIDPEYKNLVWLDSNTFDFKMNILKDLKLRRNDKSISLDSIYTELDPDRPNAKIKVKGNPNLGQVKGVMIGFRNNDEMLKLDAEVWVNELRCTGLDERGGYAATGKVDIKIADLGTLNLSGSYASIGWGALDQRLIQRARESTKQYDISTNLELGKFLPEKWGIRLPFYAQYSNNVKRPEYDPYDLDVTLDEKLARASAEKRDSITNQSISRTQIRGYSFNNVRKDRVSRTAAAPKPWEIENFSLSYSNTQTIKQDPIVELDNLTIKKLQVDYGYTRNVKYLTPFKKLIKKDKYLKFITEFNLNLLPNSFNASSLIERQLQQTTYRFAGEDPSANTYFNKRYNWLRNYSLNWDFTKSLKFAFTAANVSVIDEVNEFNPDGSRASDATKRAAISEGLQKGGRTKNYTHNVNLNYTVPLKNIPLMDWVNVRAQYAASYTWSAAALNTDSLGNVIQNTQNYQINGDLNFETLYNQWGYLRKINDGQAGANAPTRGRGARGTVPINEPAKANMTPEEKKAAKKAKKEQKAKEKKEAYEPSLLEKIVLRPMMTIRKARLVYDEKFGSIVPGFKPQSGILGQQDFKAPGWGYIAGFQPDNDWLTEAGRKEWITRSVYLNSPVILNHVQSISGTLNLEPFRDFKVDVDIKQDYTRNKTSYFKCDCDGNFSNNEGTAREIGSYTISYMSIRTMFKDGNDNLVGLFKQFEANRAIISNRLALPGSGFHEKDPGYREGYGKFQQDVLLPAFLSAYAGKDANTVRTNVFKTLPYPNWRLNYNGLAKLPFLKDVAQNISITHSYKSTLTVSSFSSDLLYDPLQPTKLNPITNSYYARLAIPNVVVNEQFAPLVGVDLRLKNDMNLRFDYKKSRNLQMSFTDYQLAETKTSEIVIGFGYIVKNIKLSFLDFLTNLDPSARIKTKKDKNAKNPTPQPTGGGNVPNNLNFKFDFSYRDDVTFNHILDQNIVQPTRGALTIRVSPSVDYTLNKSLNLRLFVDYNRTVPKTSAAPPNTSIRGGLTVRFTL